MKPTGLIVSLLAVATLLLAPAEARAHLSLRASAPAAGDTVSVAPTAIRLSFSERVEPGFASLTLIGPLGEVRIGDIVVPTDSASVVEVQILAKLVAGEYLVRWQAASTDGHPVRGEYRFTLAADPTPAATAATAAPPPAPALAAPEIAVPPSDAFGVTSPGYVAVRWGTFVALLAVIGAVAFRLLVLGRLKDQDALVAAATPRAAQLGLWAAALLLIAAFLRLAAQSLTLYGEAPSIQRVVPMLTGTLWGWGLLMQVGGTLIALAGFLLVRRGADPGWIIAALGVVALAFFPALSGHAAAVERFQTPAVIADGLHVFGAGGWLGTLLVVLAVGLPAAVHIDRHGPGGAVPGLMSAFSSAALAFAAIVVVTGVLATRIHVGGPAALAGTRYGQTLLLKLAVVAVVAGSGFFNWRRVLPALGSAEAPARLRRSAAFELAAALLVLAVTAALVATPPPGH